MKLGFGRQAAVRRAEQHLAEGDVDKAMAWLDRVDESVSDGKIALLRGQILMQSSPTEAIRYLTRAYILDEPDATDALRLAATRVRLDEEARTRLIDVFRLKDPTAVDGWQKLLSHSLPKVPWHEQLRTARFRRQIDAPSQRPRLIRRLVALAAQLNDASNVIRLDAYASTLSQPVSVVVAGEFNAGKSTFINALLGRDASPTGIVPTTAAIHRFDYPKPTDGQGPCELQFVDTPGVNALEPTHAAITAPVLAQSDLVVWLLDATQALKQSERVFLDELNRDRIPIQIVLNKLDRLKDTDRQEVALTTNRELADIGIASWTPPLALSARQAVVGQRGDAASLERSGWMTMTQWLEGSLLKNLEELRTRSFCRHVSRIVASLRATAQRRTDEEVVRRQSAQMAADALAERAADLDAEAPEMHGAIALIDEFDQLTMSLIPAPLTAKMLPLLEAVHVALRNRLESRQG